MIRRSIFLAVISSVRVLNYRSETPYLYTASIRSRLTSSCPASTFELGFLACELELGAGSVGSIAVVVLSVPVSSRTLPMLIWLQWRCVLPVKGTFEN